MKNLNEIIILVITLTTITFPQTNDPDAILKKVLDSFN